MHCRWKDKDNHGAWRIMPIGCLYSVNSFLAGHYLKHKRVPHGAASSVNYDSVYQLLMNVDRYGPTLPRLPG